VPEKRMGSREIYVFRRNVWVLEKCIGSLEMYGFSRNVWVL
jgi:hypothetical protein